MRHKNGRHVRGSLPGRTARRRLQGAAQGGTSRVWAGAGILCLAALLITAACGSTQPRQQHPIILPDDPTAAVTASSLPGDGGPGPASTSTSTPIIAEVDLDPTIRAAFLESAAALDPVPIYAPVDLPPGSVLAEEWRPLFGPSPTPAAEIPAPNPRLILGGSEPQAEVLVDIPGGVLLFLQNFRGDLGDVSGEAAGEVSGRPASRHDLDGGVLLHWGDDGRWYAVYGIGEGALWVASAAPKMRVLQP